MNQHCMARTVDSVPMSGIPPGSLATAGWVFWSTGRRPSMSGRRIQLFFVHCLNLISQASQSELTLVVHQKFEVHQHGDVEQRIRDC